MNDTNPTAGYGRVSTRIQAEKGAGLDIQEEAWLRRCAEEGWNLVGAYVDDGKSGKDESRPALDRLMADIEAGRIKRVIVYKLDRLERDLQHLLNRLAFFKVHGVELVVTDELHDTSTPAGEMLSQIVGAIAEHERKMIRSRFERAQDAAARDGKWPSGPPPYGYVTVPSPDGRGKVAVVDTAKATVMLRIVDEYLGGRSTKEIADGLQADAVPTPRKGRWDRNKVRVLLSKCHLLAGSWTFGRSGDPITIPMPPILDPATIDAVKAALQERSFVRGPAATYPLSMRVQAPCGSHTIGHANKNEVRQYICSERKKSGPDHCDCVFTPAAPLEEAAFTAVSSFLRDKDAIERLVQHRLDRLVAIVGKSGANLDDIARRITELEERLGSEASEMRSAGLGAAALAAALKPLSDELSAVTEMRESALKVQRRARQRTPTNKALRAWVADDYSDWDSATPEERREMFARLNVRVVITGWSGCGDCVGVGRVADPELMVLASGKQFRRHLGCATCGGSGGIPHIKVSGSVPAELLDHVGELVQIGLPSGSDLAFTIGDQAVA